MKHEFFLKLTPLVGVKGSDQANSLSGIALKYILGKEKGRYIFATDDAFELGEPGTD